MSSFLSVSWDLKSVAETCMLWVVLAGYHDNNDNTCSSSVPGQQEDTTVTNFSQVADY